MPRSSRTIARVVRAAALLACLRCALAASGSDGDALAASGSDGRCSKGTPCKNMGTCHLQTGVCSCPLGYGGPMCETLLWPACRITKGKTAEGHPVAMRCENWMEPRNCFCVDQCLSRRPSLARHQQTPPSHRHHSSPASSPGASPRPRLPQAQYYEDRPCFTWDGAEPDDQLSTYPPEGTPAAHFATYYSFKSSGGAGKIGREEYLAKRKDRSHIVLANVEQCPAQCSGEGNCLAPWEGAAPGCACFFGRAGGSCEVAVKELTCYGACSGHGTCVRGFCSCDPGWFGIDCAVDLSKVAHFRDRTTYPMPEEVPTDWGAGAAMEAFAGEYTREQRARRSPPGRLRVFVYELPSWLNIAAETDAQRIAGQYMQRDRGIYCAYNLFTEQLLADWSVRTADPYEANLFYVPLLPYGVTENGREGAALAERAVRIIRRQWPFWDRFGGMDHIFVAVQDAGECHMGYRDHRLPPLTRDSIWLTHWGAGQASKASVNGVPQWQPERCFETEHHIVIPPGLITIHSAAASTFGTGTGLVPNAEKDTLLMFAGNIDFNWLTYSQGVRQRAFIKFGHKEGFDITDGYVNRVNGHRSYDESMRHSVFCLAVAGGGWGQRLISALVSGCIPVVVMDNVRQPGDDVLPYHEFSLRVTQDELDDLEAILRAVPKGRVEELQAGVRRWHRYFYWLGDGLAYNLTLMSLQQKAWNVLALYPGR